MCVIKTIELGKVLKLTPQQPQTQSSVQSQLVTLYMAANRLGLYDAADLIQRLLKSDRPHQGVPL